MCVCGVCGRVCVCVCVWRGVLGVGRLEVGLGALGRGEEEGGHPTGAGEGSGGGGLALATPVVLEPKVVDVE
jgi:hypothetical protein